MDILAEGIKN